MNKTRRALAATISIFVSSREMIMSLSGTAPSVVLGRSVMARSFFFLNKDGSFFLDKDGSGRTQRAALIKSGADTGYTRTLKETEITIMSLHFLKRTLD